MTTKKIAAATSLIFATFSAYTLAADPAKKPDESWINVSGTVASASGDYFWLDYGKGKIKVEMDDWDWYKEGYAIIEGDDVSVSGMIDHDLFQKKTIEASSVYVKSLNSYFYASAVDEENVPSSYTYTTYSIVPVSGKAEYVGEITKVDGRSFIIDTGLQKMKIDTSEMNYNPLDDYGYQKLDVGDRVRVSGKVEDDIFDKTEFVADSILSLVDDDGKNKSTKVSQR